MYTKKLVNDNRNFFAVDKKNINQPLVFTQFHSKASPLSGVSLYDLGRIGPTRHKGECCD